MNTNRQYNSNNSSFNYSTTANFRNNNYKNRSYNSNSSKQYGASYKSPDSFYSNRENPVMPAQKSKILIVAKDRRLKCVLNRYSENISNKFLVNEEGNYSVTPHSYSYSTIMAMRYICDELIFKDIFRTQEIQNQLDVIEAHKKPDSEPLITVVDGTSCVGGDTALFAELFDSVIGVEYNKESYDLLVHNVSVILNNKVLENKRTDEVKRDIEPTEFLSESTFLKTDSDKNIVDKNINKSETNCNSQQQDNSELENDKTPLKGQMLNHVLLINADTTQIVPQLDLLVQEFQKKQNSLYHSKEHYFLGDYLKYRNFSDLALNDKRNLPRPTYFCLFLDPPWGGVDYKSEKEMRLNLSGIPIEKIVLDAFEKNKKLLLAVLKLPCNYDCHYLDEQLAPLYFFKEQTNKMLFVWIVNSTSTMAGAPHKKDEFQRLNNLVGQVREQLPLPQGRKRIYDSTKKQ